MWSEERSSSGSIEMSSWYSQVAARLLQDRMLLTALELHTELVEAGHEEPQLREFFSNPANFERPPADPIVRCPSQATLDSLDLTRLSEDSEKSDDVAVLEFELRKAKETINALRANLTQVAAENHTDFEALSVDASCEKILNEDSIKPHERRALNFLVYEYLLQQDLKLTSITLSDEVPDQDFECWDDVGLNIPRPAGLLSMYRGDALYLSKSTCHQETQTEELTLSDSNSTFILCPENKSSPESVESFTDQNEEIVYLKKQILALETDKVNYQKLYDAALASLNSLTSPTSDVPSSETTLYNREDNSVELLQTNEIGNNYTCEMENIDDELQPLPQTATQNYYGSSVSTNSLTPDRFEMIDSDKNGGSSQKDGSNVSSLEPAVMVEEHMVMPKSSHETLPKRNESETTLDDTSSFNDHFENEWERENMKTMKPSADENDISEERHEAWINSDIPNEYKQMLMKRCDIQYSGESAIVKDIPYMKHPISLQQFVNIVSTVLPKIIPNILLVKRDEVIPLLISTIFLHPEQPQRDKLLQLLLNLRKKMEKEDRALVVSALVLLLQWNIETNSGIDSDLLGFFWDMINSKSAEKRILGAEASIALIPYVSLELVNSLFLSMVLSMSESSDVSIRRQGLLGALLVCPTSSAAKYFDIVNLFFTSAMDNDKIISDTSIELFTPVLARTALLHGIFHTELIPYIVDKLLDAISNGEECVRILKIMEDLVPFLLYYTIDVETIKNRSIGLDYDPVMMKKFVDYINDKPFHNYQFLSVDDSSEPLRLVQTFHSITEEDAMYSWPERDWLINKWLNRLISLIVMYKNPPHIESINAFVTLFGTITLVFGHKFTNYVLKQNIETELVKIEQNVIKAEYRNQFCPILISIYLGTLSTEDDNEEIVRNVIKRWCICCGMCSISSAIIGIPLVTYTAKDQLFNVALMAIWQCIVHTSDQVRAYIASLLDYLVLNAHLPDELLNTSVIPGIITLVSDNAINVKCNAIKSLGSAVSRTDLSSNVLDKCWHTLESLTIEEKTNGSLGAFTTICLANTYHKIIVDNNDHACHNKVLPNIAMLCYSPVLTSGNMSSVNGLLEELLPSFQICTHKKLCDQFVQTTLLPALKKLESLEQKLLTEHRYAVESLIHKITTTEVQVKEHQTSTSGPHIAGHALPTLLTSPESVGRRVSQIFQQSKPAMNLQNIFKKK